MEIKKQQLLYPLTLIALAIYYVIPFLKRYDYWGVRDWDLFATIAAVPVGSILEYGQFPFWNPYMGGGNILFHHPEVAVLSPFFLLYMVFGAVVGLKLQVAICYLIGFWGSFRLFQRFGHSRLAALMASVAYFGSVHFALHFAEGHMPFTHFCFLPWFVYFVHRSTERKRDIIMAGFSLALMVLGNGAAIPLLYTLTFSVLLFGLTALQQREIIWVKNLLLATMIGLGLAAVKFLPMTVYLLNNKWEGNPAETIPVGALWKIFFGWNHSLFARNFEGQYWGWHEYGAYLSPILVVLALVAIVYNFRRLRVWLFLILFFLLLGLGDVGSWSPWRILSSLPGFSSARCTGRAFQFVLLGMAMLGGYGFDHLSQRVFTTSRWLARGLYAALALIIVTNLIFAWPIMNSAFKTRPEPVFRSLVFAHVIDKKPQAYRNYLANRGSLITPWLSAYHPSRALVDNANRVLPEYVAEGSASVTNRLYTPNRIEYAFEADRAGRMMIGMGFDEGWKATDGRPLSDQNGLITFDFEPGPQQVTLVYRTPWFYTGLVITLLMSLFTIVLWRRWRVTPVSEADSNSG